MEQTLSGYFTQVKGNLFLVYLKEESKRMHPPKSYANMKCSSLSLLHTWVRYCKFIPISPSRSKLPEVAHTVLWFKSLCVTFYVFLAAFWHNEEGSCKKEEYLKLFLEIISNIKYSCKNYLIYPDSSIVTFCHIHWFSFSLSCSLSPHIDFFLNHLTVLANISFYPNILHCILSGHSLM